MASDASPAPLRLQAVDGAGQTGDATIWLGCSCGRQDH
jgi:hypothetical protein